MIICTDRFRCITYYRAYLMIKYNLDTHQGVDFDGPTGDYLNRIIHIDYFSKWIIIMKMFDGIVLYNYILNNILTIFDYKNSGDFSFLKFSHYFLILFKRKTESKIDDYKTLKDKTDTALNKSESNEKRLDEIEDNNRWVFRTSIGAIITSVAGIIFLFIKLGMGIN